MKMNGRSDGRNQIGKDMSTIGAVGCKGKTKKKAEVEETPLSAHNIINSLGEGVDAHKHQGAGRVGLITCTSAK